MPLCIPEYNRLEIHKLMLLDGRRTKSYYQAIAKKISRESIVIDFGSDTSILSLVAARAGAKKVYAVERTRIAEISKKIICDNELLDKIEIIHCNSANVCIPEAVDFLVSEWMGVHVFQENMLPDLIDIRDKYLKKDGKIIPEAVSLFVAPLRINPIAADEIDRWEEPLEGFSFEEIFRLSLNDTYISDILPKMLASEGVRTLELDLYTVNKSDLHSIVMNAEFYFPCHDEISGICGWFSAKLAEGIVLETGPSSAPTHWKQTIYPLYPKIEVTPGDILVLQIIVEPDRGFSHFTWIGYVKGKESSTHRKFSTKNNYTLPSASIDHNDSKRIAI